MSWLRGWLGRGAWDLASVERPWTDGPAIHAHIRAHLSPETGSLTESGRKLPDEKDDGGIKWVAGGLDGAFGHHGGGRPATARAKRVYRALAAAVRDATASNLARLYAELRRDDALELIDPLLERIVTKRKLDPARTEELAAWLAEHAPDRGPVKVAIGILGLVQGTDHTELLTTLGKHEELTLYASVALANRGGDDAERRLFELARHVHGWGRIQLVERLAGTSDPEIKSWMLREGYRNSVMYEYLAHTCATAGELRAELERDEIDPALLVAAGEILCALFTGGPARDIDDYSDGARVTERYLHHLGDEPGELGQLITIGFIDRFLSWEADWSAREGLGWTPALRERLAARIGALKQRPQWKGLVEAELASEDPATFARADAAARVIGIDTWGHHFSRLESGNHDGWFRVMRTDDPERIDRVVALAERTLPLDEIASGPGDEMGFGPEWSAHGHLDFVLQDLRRFPTKGWPLIRAGIRSPVVRNRHMALIALSYWGKQAWPPDAEALLDRALSEEPDQTVRDEIEAVRAGETIGEQNPFAFADLLS